MPSGGLRTRKRRVQRLRSRRKLKRLNEAQLKEYRSTFTTLTEAVKAGRISHV